MPAAELVDLIISFLHPVPLKRGNSDDNYLSHDAAANVGKCALVCRAWVPSSRRVLFYRVHVKRYTAHGFAKLFCRPQRLTFLPFIRELEFRSGIPQNSWMKSVLPKLTKHLPSSINTLALNFDMASAPNPFPRPNLTGVTNLEISDWNSRSMTLDLGALVEFIVSFPLLEGLKCYTRGWRSAELPDRIQALSPPQTLRRLDFTGPDMGRFLGWLGRSRAAVSTLRLSDETNPMTSASFKSAVGCIRGLGPSLTSLALKVHLWSPEMPIAVAMLDDFLKENTQLRTLSICANPTLTAAILKHAHFPPSLEYVTLALAVTVNFGGRICFLNKEIHDAPLLLPPWSELDLILSPLISLKKVEIALGSQLYYEDHMNPVRQRFDEISAGMLQMLPLCAARGIVTHVVLGKSRWWR
ncbi:hypothetical protein B0H11DRAFT_656819 [Mycena galericulata]|nr:hypothetical protein B0H11DRAFT_656819 [Mycena galericulata]